MYIFCLYVENVGPCIPGTLASTIWTLDLRQYDRGTLGLAQGDCLWSIAQKRNIEVTQIKALNPGLVDATEDFLLPGDTIILPAGKLSTRDLEILAGIGAGSTRIYPVRKGETIDAIASNRNIPLSKLEALNPGVDLQVRVVAKYANPPCV